MRCHAALPPSRTRQLVITIACLLSGLRVAAEELQSTVRIPLPPAEIYERWVEMPFETEEIWRFRSREEYARLIEDSAASPAQKEQLKSLYLDALPAGTWNAGHVEYALDKPGGYVPVPRALRREIPPSLAASVYEYAWQNYRSEPRLSIPRRRLESDTELAPPARAALARNFVKVNGREVVPVGPYNWELVPLGMRREMIHHFLSESLKQDEGLQAKLLLRPQDDLAAIARKYAAGRDPRPLERYLRKALGSAASVEVPLENILPPFIRKYLDTYAPCHGPNCYNAALNAQRGRSHRRQHSSASDLIQEATSRLRFVRPAEALAAGDLLIYLNPRGDPVHAATYLANGLVFTKSGMTRYAPYVFQRLETGERYYFPQGKYYLVAMRTPAAGELAADSEHQSPQLLKHAYREHPAGSGTPPGQSRRGPSLLEVCQATWKALTRPPFTNGSR